MANDNYQAIYDATREALDFSWARAEAEDAIRAVRREMTRPSVLLRPRVALVCGKWLAQYSGVSGFGSSPEAACCAFDNAWVANNKEGK